MIFIINGIDPVYLHLLLHQQLCLYHRYPASHTVLILQDSHHPKQRPDELFYHPLMQTQMMVVGMSMCFLAHLFLTRNGKQDALNT